MTVYGNDKVDGTYSISHKFTFWPYGAPVYEHNDKSKKLYIFWDHQLADWKIGPLSYLGRNEIASKKKKKILFT